MSANPCRQQPKTGRNMSVIACRLSRSRINEQALNDDCESNHRGTFSPAFDIVAEARGRGSNSISGVDWCRDFRFILHLFLG
jgi:hypothetical protein